MIGAMPDRPTKITFAELREQAFAASWCIAPTTAAATLSRSAATNGRMMFGYPDLEPGFVCTARGKRGADITPDFHWDKPGLLTRGF
jgi:hypothetical protein